MILNGDFDGIEYPLAAEETLIGRNPTTDMTLLDEGISREHALILFDADSDVYTIEDLQSHERHQGERQARALARARARRRDPGRPHASSSSYVPSPPRRITCWAPRICGT